MTVLGVGDGSLGTVITIELEIIRNTLGGPGLLVLFSSLREGTLGMDGTLCIYHGQFGYYPI